MSTIPSGLTAKQMRERMLDKATITKTGSLYMGGSSAVSYQDIGSTIPAKEIEELEAGTQYYLLTSRGSGQTLNYAQLQNTSIQDEVVTKSKLGLGTIVQAGSAAKKNFNVTGVAGSNAPDQINILFNNVVYSLGNGCNVLKLKDANNSSTEYPVVKLQDNEGNEMVWCKKFTLTEQNPGYGVGSITYERTNNYYCPNISQSEITTSDPIYYGDNITISYTAAQYYTLQCYCNGEAVTSGNSVRVKSNTNIQLIAEPRMYVFRVSTSGGSVTPLYANQVVITRISSHKADAPLGILTPRGASSSIAEYEVYEDDVITVTATSGAYDTRDQILQCLSDNTMTTGYINVPIGTQLVVNHTNFGINPSYLSILRCSIQYIQRQLTLTLGTGVHSITYRQHNTNGSYSAWTTITSSQTVNINSGSDVYLGFTVDSGYIGTENYFRYQNNTSYHQDYKIIAMRTNQTWKPVTYKNGSSVSISATYTGAGTNHPRCTLTVTNNMSERIYLSETSAPLISFSSGTSIIGGAASTFSGTGTGSSANEPHTGDVIYLHFWTGAINPYQAGAVHYGTTGTITVS